MPVYLDIKLLGLKQFVVPENIHTSPPPPSHPWIFWGEGGGWDHKSKSFKGQYEAQYTFIGIIFREGRGTLSQEGCGYFLEQYDATTWLYNWFQIKIILAVFVFSVQLQLIAESLASSFLIWCMIYRKWLYMTEEDFWMQSGMEAVLMCWTCLKVERLTWSKETRLENKWI